MAGIDGKMTILAMDTATMVVMAGTAVGVIVVKLLGLGSVAVLLGAVVGVLAGLAYRMISERRASR